MNELFGTVPIEVLARMLANQEKLWVSLSTATSLIDVSDDTIERRAMSWQKQPEPHRIRYKVLVLGKSTRAERRYYLPDVLALLADPRLHRRGRPPKKENQAFQPRSTAAVQGRE